MENPFITEHKYTPFDLVTVENIREAILDGIKVEDEEIAAIVNNPEPPTFKNTILALEEGDERFGRACTVMSNLLSACRTDELEALSHEVSPLLAEHSNNISFNERLFARVKVVRDEMKALGDKCPLTEEEMRMLDGTYEGFERSGVMLPPDKKTRFREISVELSDLCLKFSENNLRATNSFQLHLTNEKDLIGLTETARIQAAAAAAERGLDGWVFTLHAPSYGPFMSYSERRDLRETMYRASVRRCTEYSDYNNFEIVRRIINLRLEMTKLLGAECVADHVLARRMAGNKDNVYKLLNKLTEGYRSQAIVELEDLKRKARDLEGEDFEIQPWDYGYYGHKLQLERYDLDSEMLRPYLPLQQVIDGVFGLATRLYGITFRPNTECPLYHPDVKAFDVIDNDGTPLALLYTDFYPRNNKQSGAWMTDFRGQYIDDNGNNHIPHISIVMNFTKPTQERPALLSMGEVSTLLHEFGHALHGMFSKVHHRNMGGTNVYWDFVELPSQFMENYALEPEFLQSFAHHYQTGEPMPNELIERMVNARNYNVASGCLRQVRLGLLDMAYYTITEPLEGDIREFENRAWASAMIDERDPESCTTVTFGHIISGGYAAGYYSYKWAEVLDADAFSAFKEEGIFNTVTAERFRQEILSKGNTREPMELYKAFRGQEPTIDALLRRDGILQ